MDTETRLKQSKQHRERPKLKRKSQQLETPHSQKCYRDKRGSHPREVANKIKMRDCSQPKSQESTYKLKSSNSEHTCSAGSPSAPQEVVTLDRMSDQGLVAIGSVTNTHSPPKKSCLGENSIKKTDLVRSDLLAKQERHCTKSPDFKAEHKLSAKQQRRYTCRYSAIDDTCIKKQNISRSSDLSKKELPVLPLSPLKGTSGPNFANTFIKFHKKPHLTSSNTSDFSSHKINSPRSSVYSMAKSCVSPSTLQSLKLHLSKHLPTGVNSLHKSNLGSSLDSIPVCQKETLETVPCFGCSSATGISHSVKRGLCFKLNKASKSFQATPLSNILSVQQGKQTNCDGQQFSGINISLLPSTGSVNFATGVLAQDCESYILNGKHHSLESPVVPAQQIYVTEPVLPYLNDNAKSSFNKDTSLNLEGIPTSYSKRESIPSLKSTVSKLQKKLDDLISKSTSRGDADHSSLVNCSKGLCASLSTQSNPEEKETLQNKSEDKVSTPVLLPQAKDKEFIWLTGLDVVVDSLLQMSS